MKTWKDELDASRSESLSVAANCSAHLAVGVRRLIGLGLETGAAFRDIETAIKSLALPPSGR
jgi:hypothetical protein